MSENKFKTKQNKNKKTKKIKKKIQKKLIINSPLSFSENDPRVLLRFLCLIVSFAIISDLLKKLIYFSKSSIYFSLTNF